MNNKKIVFIQPPVSLDDIYKGLAKVGSVSPPINLLLLAAVVREKGFEPSIIDCPAHGYSYNGVIERLKILKPKFAGITAMTPHILQAGKLAEKIKKELPEIIIILGGTHISALPFETMKKFPSIDIGVIGEAENSLPELLKAFIEKQNINKISGLIINHKNGLKSTGIRKEKIILDKLPFYAWDILDGFPKKYKTSFFAAHKSPATPIITSRGCPGKCIYCFSGCHLTISTYSDGYILNLLKHLKYNYGIKEFQIFDDNFLMYRKNIKNLLTSIINSKLDMTWSCNARVDMVNEEIIKLMAEAGCWNISFGIETGNQEIMNLIKKKINKEKIINAIKWSKKYGIRTVGYFMIGHFMETKETIEETIKFSKNIGLDDFRMSFFTPLPGTSSYDIACKYGNFEKDWSKMTLFSPIFIPKGMTKELLIKNHKKALREFFFRPKIIFKYLKTISNPLIALKGAVALAQYIFSKKQ